MNNLFGVVLSMLMLVVFLHMYFDDHRKDGKR